MAVEKQRVDAALENLRVPVSVILSEGNDPVEVLDLGALVSRHAPEDTDLTALREHLANSTLSEVVGDVAFAMRHDGEEVEDARDPDAGVDLGEEDDLLGSD